MLFAMLEGLPHHQFGCYRSLPDDQKEGRTLPSSSPRPTVACCLPLPLSAQALPCNLVITKDVLAVDLTWCLIYLAMHQGLDSEARRILKAYRT